jgi:hypothetical protein
MRYLVFLLMFVVIPAQAVVTLTGKTHAKNELVECADGTWWSQCLPGNEVVTNTAPVISLNGGNVTYTVGDTYSELGATCSDSEDGAIAVPAPSFSPALNMNSAGSYVATYTCTDSGSLTDTATRSVYVNSAGGSTDLAFTNVTTAAIDIAPEVFFPFGAHMPDLNGDGCFDLFIGSHADTDPPSSVMLQDVANSACSGTFSHFANSNNYTQASPQIPRITGRYNFANFTGSSKGLWSFWGTDVDGSAAALYEIDDSATSVGGNPTFKAKRSLCLGNSRCVPIDSNGDGDIELIHSHRDSTWIREIRDIQTDTIIHASDTSNTSDQGHHQIVFDINGDTYPDICTPEVGGCWVYNSSTTEYDWAGNKFTGFTDPNPNHTIVFDYDSDGDSDMLFNYGEYDPDTPFNWALWQNDGAGNFSDVTAASGLMQMGFVSENYWTYYSNAQAVDINNDGYPDILYGGISYGNDLDILINDGDGSFSHLDDLNFGSALQVGKAWAEARDYDNDGLIDIVKTNNSLGANHENIALYKNTSAINNNWLRVRPVGVGNNTDGFHTRLIVKQAGTNNVITSHEVVNQQGNSGLIPHLGLGANSNIDIEVIYPHGGASFTLSNVAVNQDIVIYTNGSYTTYQPGSAIPIVAEVGSLDTQIQLIANTDATMTANEVVTLGIPLAHGDMTSLDNLQVLNDSAQEVSIYAECLISWHFKSTGQTDCRAAKVQFVADMSGGNLTYSVTNAGRTTANDIAEQAIARIASSNTNHDGIDLPRVFVQHNPDYLLASGISTPMGAQSANVYDDTFYPNIFTQHGGLDYGTSTYANWQFDRVTSLSRQYIRTGAANYHREMLASANFYFAQFSGTGAYNGSTDCAGHFTYKPDCDPKYTYAQAAKLYLALTGDDETITSALVTDMVEFNLQKAPAEFAGWKNDYAMGDWYTERRAGWRFESVVAGCEILGTSSWCDALPAYVQNMHDHVFNNPDTQTPASDGSHRHSWARHEGASYPGDDVATDLRFSPWMQVLLSDALWQYWQILDSGTTKTQVEEILAGHGQALALYGFNRASYETGTLTALESAYAATAATYSNTARAQSWGCNDSPSPVMAYSGTSVYTPALDDPDHLPANTDSHNSEAITTLALAAYFEPDTAKRSALIDVADDIATGFYPTCGAQANVPRYFGWSTRSAPYPTLQYVKSELSI